MSELIAVVEDATNTETADIMSSVSKHETTDKDGGAMSPTRLATIVIDAGCRWTKDEGVAQGNLREYKKEITQIRDEVFCVREGSKGIVAKLTYVDENGEEKTWSGIWKEFLRDFFNKMSPRQIRRILNEPAVKEPKNAVQDHEKPLWKAGYEAGLEQARVEVEQHDAKQEKVKAAVAKAKTKSKSTAEAKEADKDEPKFAMVIDPSFAEVPIALAKESTHELNAFAKRYHIQGGHFVTAWVKDEK